MDIGNKIRQLRHKAFLTQEQLAEKLNVSAQAVSKWENGISMPDITLLPFLSEAFGVSIDEMFDLTVDQKLRRIESRMLMEEELEFDVFCESREFLMDQLNKHNDRHRILSLLARLYHHRMEADSKKGRRICPRSDNDGARKKGMSVDIAESGRQSGVGLECFKSCRNH